MDHYVADPLLLVLGLLALLTPRALLERSGSGRSRRRSSRRQRDHERDHGQPLYGGEEVHVVYALTRRINWIDFARGAAGAQAVAYFAFSWEWIEPEKRAQITPFILGGIFTVAILVQMFRRRVSGLRPSMYGPAAFVLGILTAGHPTVLGEPLMAGYSSWVIVGVGMLGLLAMKFLITNPITFFALLTVVHAGLWYAFGSWRSVAFFVYGALPLIPVVLCLLFRARVEFDEVDPAWLAARRE